MSRPRVLVVEDESLLVMTLEDWLSDWGFEMVGPAMTLSEATALATTATIDAAILDVNIGGKVSYGVAELLAGRGIPYVFATGYGASAKETVGPAVKVVFKPYRGDELREAIHAALRGHHAGSVC